MGKHIANRIKHVACTRTMLSVFNTKPKRGGPCRRRQTRCAAGMAAVPFPVMPADAQHENLASMACLPPSRPAPAPATAACCAEPCTAAPCSSTASCPDAAPCTAAAATSGPALCPPPCPAPCRDLLAGTAAVCSDGVVWGRRGCRDLGRSAERWDTIGRRKNRRRDAEVPDQKTDGRSRVVREDQVGHVPHLESPFIHSSAAGAARCTSHHRRPITAIYI